MGGRIQQPNGRAEDEKGRGSPAASFAVASDDRTYMLARLLSQ